MRDTVWLVLGTAFLVAGLVSLARFAIGDRPRGRRRCPRCWYDMSGAIDTCPECGRQIRSARELTRTRRPRRWLLLAILLFGGSLAAGWQTAPLHTARLVPDWALIAGMEHSAGGTLGNELLGRLRRGELSQAAQHDLILKSTRLLERSTDAEVLQLAGRVLSDAETFGRTISPKGYFPWAVAPTECVAPERLVRALAPLLEHEDSQVRDAAASALSDLAPAAAVLVPTVLVRCAGDPSKHSRAVVDAHFSAAFEPLRRTLADATLRPEEHAGLLDFARTLAELPAETEVMRATLLDALANDNDEVAALAAWMLRTCCRDDDECRLHALATYDPTRAATAPILLSYALHGPLDNTAAKVIREALSSGGGEHWRMAVLGLANRGKEAAAFLPDMEPLLETPRAQLAARTYAKIGGDPERAARAVLMSMSNEEYRGELLTLAGIGWLGQPVIELFRLWLESEYPHARLEAAVALLRCGPPDEFNRDDLTRIAMDALLGPEGDRLSTDHFEAIVLAGLADLPEITNALDNADQAQIAPFIEDIAMLGSRAEGALPWLRQVAASAHPQTLRQARHAIRRIEWCLDHGDPPPAPRDDH